MNVNAILRELRAERDRIDQALTSLEKLAQWAPGHSEQAHLSSAIARGELVPKEATGAVPGTQGRTSPRHRRNKVPDGSPG
jgi:ABC-type transporter Mla subunit MlaD